MEPQFELDINLIKKKELRSPDDSSTNPPAKKADGFPKSGTTPPKPKDALLKRQKEINPQLKRAEKKSGLTKEGYREKRSVKVKERFERPSSGDRSPLAPSMTRLQKKSDIIFFIAEPAAYYPPHKTNSICERKKGVDSGQIFWEGLLSGGGEKSYSSQMQGSSCLKREDKKSLLTKEGYREKVSVKRKERFVRRKTIASSGDRRTPPTSPAKLQKRSDGKFFGSQPLLYHPLRMVSQSYESEGEVDRALILWERILSGGGDASHSLQMKGSDFSLSLDPAKYPIFTAADGGKIIVDAKGTLPPLVKTIIQEKEPKVRIIAENPDNRKRFYSALLDAARFYSMEENFTLNFGSDPKLTVTSNFKIEKNGESLLLNDIILLNIDEKQMGTPSPLVNFLATQGFRVVDLYPVSPGMQGRGQRLFYSITTRNQRAIVDSIMKALSLRYDAEREMPLDNGSLSGVSLSVRVDRYFEIDGKGVVISFSEADRVNSASLKLLENRGFRVVIIKPTDGFRKISGKIFSVMKMNASYGMHSLWKPQEAPFDLQLSGCFLPAPYGEGRVTFLSDIKIDPLTRELIESRGYTVIAD